MGRVHTMPGVCGKDHEIVAVEYYGADDPEGEREYQPKGVSRKLDRDAEEAFSKTMQEAYDTTQRLCSPRTQASSIHTTQGSLVLHVRSGGARFLFFAASRSRNSCRPLFASLMLAAAVSTPLSFAGAASHVACAAAAGGFAEFAFARLCFAEVCPQVSRLCPRTVRMPCWANALLSASSWSWIPVARPVRSAGAAQIATARIRVR